MEILYTWQGFCQATGVSVACVVPNAANRILGNSGDTILIGFASASLRASSPLRDLRVKSARPKFHAKAAKKRRNAKIHEVVPSKPSRSARDSLEGKRKITKKGASPRCAGGRLFTLGENEGADALPLFFFFLLAKIWRHLPAKAAPSAGS
jgi:hypothetical protein